MTSSLTAEPLIYTERTDDDEFEPTQEDIEEFAKRIGINLASEPELLYLAREGLRAPLPSGWKPCRQKRGDKDLWFYYNTKTQLSQWEHPMDPVYRQRVIQARSELALNKIQSFDPLTMRPPKSLPPLKRSGGSLAPINPATSSLGKLGGFGPAAGDLRQGTPNSALSGNIHNPLNNSNNNPLGRLQHNNNSKIISGSPLNSLKDTDDDEDDSARFMRPPRKAGLTLTGGGANFLKGSEGFTRTKGGLASSNANSLDQSEGIHDSDAGGAGDSDKKPIKKEEKALLSQFESTTTSKSKGNVKFNLDDNTELKFELSGDENDDYSPSHDPRKHEEDTEDEVEVNERNSPDEVKRVGNNETTFITQYSEEEISALKKAMRDAMESELNKFKEQLEEERKSRQEQIQKHLEETVAQYKLEKEETIKRVKREMENERTFEVDKAKREIDNLLQHELGEMKVKFDNALQAKQRELEEEHQKKIDELTAEFRKNEEEKLSEALKQQASEEVLKAAEQELKKQKENLREDHRRQLTQMKDYHKTILEKLKADLLAEEEKLRQDHLLKQAEMVSKFEQDTEELRKKLIRNQKEALEKVQAEFELKKSALEESLTASLQDVRDRLYQNKRSVSDTNISDKAAEDELRSMKAKYQQLENKYKSMKHELHHLTQEMSARRRSSLGNSPSDQKASLRATRPIPNNKTAKMNESFDVSDTNQDSAHGSDSNTDSNSSLYPSSDAVGQVGSIKVGNSPLHKADSSSQTNRINAALQALETLKQEILDLKDANSNKQSQQGSASHGMESKNVHHRSGLSSGSKLGSSHHESHSARKKSSTSGLSGNSGKSAKVKDLSGQHSEAASEDTHQRIVEDAKAFIRMQKNRLKDPSPIPNSSHLILPTTKNNLLLFDEKLLKSVSPRRPASIHLDLVSETESSGVSSLKDHRSSESKKLSKDIDEICNSLISLDQQMKLMWSVVKEKQQHPFYHQDESAFLNTNSSTDYTALIPNAMPLILGKSTRVCASLPNSARKPLVPTTAMMTSAGALPSNGIQIPQRSYSSLLSNNPNSSSQTVLEALRMSGLSTTRLDCTELLQSLEEELKDFKSTKQRLFDIHEAFSTDDKKAASPRHKNNSNSNILAKTKDLQEWIKKY